MTAQQSTSCVAITRSLRLLFVLFTARPRPSSVLASFRIPSASCARSKASSRCFAYSAPFISREETERASRHISAREHS
jgi:hypothetical protein